MYVLHVDVYGDSVLSRHSGQLTHCPIWHWHCQTGFVPTQAAALKQAQMADQCGTSWCDWAVQCQQWVQSSRRCFSEVVFLRQSHCRTAMYRQVAFVHGPLAVAHVTWKCTLLDATCG